MEHASELGVKLESSQSSWGLKLKSYIYSTFILTLVPCSFLPNATRIILPTIA